MGLSNISENKSVDSTPRLSVDAILFVLLWSAQFWSSDLSAMFLPSRQSSFALVANLSRVMSFDPVASFLVIALLIYLSADLWMIGNKQFWVKLMMLWVTIIAFVIVPTLAAIIFRHNDSQSLFAHDGSIQIEEAIKFLLAGKNPYVENYLATPMAHWPYYEPSQPVNPALYHLIYLPFTFLASVPLYLLSQATLGWYDQRFLSLILYVLLVVMLLGLSNQSIKKLGAVMVVALNPLFVPFFIEGRNDIIVLFGLVGMILFLQRRQIIAASVFVVMVIASKQTAWFLVPFYSIYVIRLFQDSISWKSHLLRARSIFPAVILLALILLPFVIWDLGAFLDDTILYQAGTSNGTSYPIKSLGLGGLALGLDWVQQSTDPFPFLPFQVIFGSIVLLFQSVKQWYDNNLVRVLTNFAILFLVSAFFSRVFNDNHLGFGLICLLLPMFIDEPVSLNVKH